MDKKLSIIIAGMMAGKKYYCSACKKEVKGFKDKISVAEFKIGGLCQDCQDKIFPDYGY